jgi:hypothetical protein
MRHLRRSSSRLQRDEVDWRTIRLLIWLRYRQFVNSLNAILSERKARLLIYFYAFVSTVFGLVLYSLVVNSEPVGPLSPVHQEALGVLFFLLMALIVAFSAAFSQSLTTHEEDILLTSPMEDHSIVQTELMSGILLAVPVLFLFTIGVLWIETHFTGIEAMGRLPYAFFSVLLFFLIVFAKFSILNGLWKKYSRITQRFGNHLAVVGMILVLSIPFILLFLGLQFLVDLYYHPIVRFLLVLPISSAQIYFLGSVDSSIMIQIAIQLALAVLFLVYAFRFRYELFLPKDNWQRGGERVPPTS